MHSIHKLNDNNKYYKIYILSHDSLFSGHHQIYIYIYLYIS